MSDGERPSLLGPAMGRNDPLANFVDWALPIFSLSLQLLSRRHFGAQYITPARIVGAIIVVPIFIKLLMFLGSFSGGDPFQDTFLLDTYILLLTCAGIWRLLEINHKEFNGIRWYSRCRGISYKFWRYLPVLKHFPYFVQRWTEPAFWFIVGYVVSFTGPGYLAFYFFFASLMLFFEEGMAQRVMLRDYWNMMGGHIQTDNLRASVLERKPPEETEGYWNPMASRLDMNFRLRYIAREEEGYQDYLQRLDALVDERGLPKDLEDEQEKQKNYFKPLVNALKRFLTVKD